MFFTLSAFLLTRQILYRGLSRATFVDYALGRIIRIYPLFVLFVLLYYAAGWIGLSTWNDVASALTLSAGYGHLWTIPVECKFYFVLPLVVFVLFAIEQKGGAPAVLILVGAFTALHQVFWPYWTTPELTTSLIPYLPMFLFGVAAAFLHGRPVPSWLPATLIACAILAVSVLTLPFFMHAIFGMPYGDYLNDKFLFYGLGFSFIIWAVTSRGSRLTQALETKPLILVGRWSYSIYLGHFLILYALGNILPDMPIRPVIYATAAIVLSIALGALCFWMIERPLLKSRSAIRSTILPFRSLEAPAQSPG